VKVVSYAASRVDAVDTFFAIVIGFPIALVIAWAFELTPEGLKRTEDVDLASQARKKSNAWIYVVIVGAAFSIGLSFIGRYTARNTVSAAGTEAATGSSVQLRCCHSRT